MYKMNYSVGDKFTKLNELYNDSELIEQHLSNYANGLVCAFLSYFLRYGHELEVIDTRQ